MLPLVCIDVDGTLVGPAGEPTDMIWQAARAAIDRGQHLALSTARGAMGPTLEWARRLDPNGWHVFHAGAALVHTGTPGLDTVPLADAAVELALRASAEHGWTLELYSARDYVVTDNGPLAADHAVLIGVPIRVGGPGDLDAHIVRAQFVVLHDDVPAVADALGGAATVSTATSPAMIGATFVSVTAPGATKEAAIARLATRLGVDLDRVMMVGDGHNDLAAVKVVGHGVAMGNAEPEVRAAARHVVADVTNDGLAEALALSATL